VRESTGNYKYLVKLGKVLCKEYTYRYNKTRKCDYLINQMGHNIPDKRLTRPTLAIPNMYKSDNVI
jgi:hypothetical protein